MKAVATDASDEFLQIRRGGDRVVGWHSESLPLLRAVNGVGFTWCILWPSARLTAKLWQGNGFLVSSGAVIGRSGSRVSGWRFEGLLSLIATRCQWDRIHLL